MLIALAVTIVAQMFIIWLVRGLILRMMALEQRLDDTVDCMDLMRKRMDVQSNVHQSLIDMLKQVQQEGV